MQLFAVISSFNGSRLFGAVSVGTSEGRRLSKSR